MLLNSRRTSEKKFILFLILFTCAHSNLLYLILAIEKRSAHFITFQIRTGTFSIYIPCSTCKTWLELLAWEEVIRLYFLDRPCAEPITEDFHFRISAPVSEMSSVIKEKEKVESDHRSSNASLVRDRGINVMISANTLKTFTPTYKTWDKATRSCSQHVITLFTLFQSWINVYAFYLINGFLSPEWSL